MNVCIVFNDNDGLWLMVVMIDDYYADNDTYTMTKVIC